MEEETRVRGFHCAESETAEVILEDREIMSPLAESL